MDPTKTPSGMPPPGVTPNFIDPPNQASIATVFVTVTLALMIVMVAFRVHADIWISRKLESAGCACLLFSFSHSQGTLSQSKTADALL